MKLCHSATYSGSPSQSFWSFWTLFLLLNVDHCWTAKVPPSNVAGSSAFDFRSLFTLHRRLSLPSPGELCRLARDGEPGSRVLAFAARDHHFLMLLEGGHLFRVPLDAWRFDPSGIHSLLNISETVEYRSLEPYFRSPNRSQPPITNPINPFHRSTESRRSFFFLQSSSSSISGPVEHVALAEQHSTTTAGRTVCVRAWPVTGLFTDDVTTKSLNVVQAPPTVKCVHQSPADRFNLVPTENRKHSRRTEATAMRITKNRTKEEKGDKKQPPELQLRAIYRFEVEQNGSVRIVALDLGGSSRKAAGSSKQSKQPNSGHLRNQFEAGFLTSLHSAPHIQVYLNRSGWLHFYHRKPEEAKVRDNDDDDDDDDDLDEVQDSNIRNQKPEIANESNNNRSINTATETVFTHSTSVISTRQVFILRKPDRIVRLSDFLHCDSLPVQPLPPLFTLALTSMAMCALYGALYLTFLCAVARRRWQEWREAQKQAYSLRLPVETVDPRYSLSSATTPTTTTSGSPTEAHYPRKTSPKASPATGKLPETIDRHHHSPLDSVRKKMAERVQRTRVADTKNVHRSKKPPPENNVEKKVGSRVAELQRRR